LFCFTEIPLVIIITKIDKFDARLSTDVSSVFKNTKVKDVVMEMSKLFGIPGNKVLPLKNYDMEVTLDTGVDILVLIALRQMLHSAEDHLDNAQMREAMSAMRVRGAGDVQGRRARDDETASEAI